MKKCSNLKIGILTYSYIRNTGAKLQSECIYKEIEATFDCDVEFIIPVDLEFKNYFTEPPGKYYKVPIKKPNNRVSTEVLSPVDTEIKTRIFKHLDERYDIIIVGSDEILRCPNTVFWLDNNMKCKKIMLAPSCWNAQEKQFKIDVKQCLQDFDILTHRDEATKNFYNSKEIDSEFAFCPDPTFIGNINHKLSPKLADKFSTLKEKKILFLSLYKRTPIVNRLIKHYENQDFKVIDIDSLNAENHKDWFVMHSLPSLCVTDKFHGTISCLLNKTKVIGIESARDPQYSKMKDLYHRFDILDLYFQKNENIPRNIDRLITDYDFDSIDQTIQKFNDIWSKMMIKIAEVLKK